MTPEEIIKADADERKLDHEPIFSTIEHWIHTGQAVAFHENDSVLLVKKIGEKEAELHLFTSDKPMTLVKSLIRFIERIYDTDLDAVYGKADKDHIIEMLKMLGQPVEESDKEQYNWKVQLV